MEGRKMDGEKTKLINDQIKQTRARTLACTGEGQLFGSSSSRATFLEAIVLRCCMQPLSLFSICLYLALRLDVIYNIYSTLSFALDVVSFFNLQVTS
jgi:hypothetical protein